MRLTKKVKERPVEPRHENNKVLRSRDPRAIYRKVTKYELLLSIRSRVSSLQFCQWCSLFLAFAELNHRRQRFPYLSSKLQYLQDCQRLTVVH